MQAVQIDGFAPIDGEMWRQVSDKYFISNMGRWWSVVAHKLLKQRPNVAGYMRAYTSLDGRKDTFTHITVVNFFGDRFNKTFHKNLIDDCLSIDHVNGDKRDNRQCNLEIVTHKENCRRYHENKKLVEITAEEVW